MRTTIRLPDDLLAEAKTLAAAERSSLTRIIEDALRESFMRRRRARERQPVRLISFRGQGLRPGVDLDNSADLLDLMEWPDDPA
jgi:hypothetical protein